MSSPALALRSTGPGCEGGSRAAPGPYDNTTPNDLGFRMGGPKSRVTSIPGHRDYGTLDS